jgi:hypothetical protein
VRRGSEARQTIQQQLPAEARWRARAPATNPNGKEARMQQNAGSRGGEGSPPGTTSRRQAADTRQYDSFVVRVWRHPGADRLVRADVRHVQSGESDSAIDCDATWIGDTLGRHLAERPGKPRR